MHHKTCNGRTQDLTVLNTLLWTGAPPKNCITPPITDFPFLGFKIVEKVLNYVKFGEMRLLGELT